MAPAKDRMNMVELACRENPRFSASSLEVDAGERSYSVLTLARIKGLYPDAAVFFILGVDAFLEIGMWKDHERVLNECFFIVLSRPGYRLEEVAGILGGAVEDRMFAIPGGERIGEVLPESRRIFLLAIRALAISATEIRRRVLAGEEIKELVSEPVENYIRTHHLYQGA